MRLARRTDSYGQQLAVSISDKIFTFTHLSRQTRCHNCDKPARAPGKRALLNKHYEDSVPLNVDPIWE